MIKMNKRIVMSVLGVTICAFSVALFKIASFGVDPFQSFMSGLDKLIPINFGTLYVIVNVIMLSFSLMFNRKLVGIATFVNLFLLGYMVEFFMNIFQGLLNTNLIMRLLVLIAAIIIMCFGSSLYMTADLGVSTYDAIAITLSEKWHMGKFKMMRIITDVVCVIIGCVLYVLGGGKINELHTFVGIGTLITAFFMGPLIALFNVKFSNKLLK